MAVEFPHKIWAHLDHRQKYDESVARILEKNPDAIVPSHLDPRGLNHVLGLLQEMEDKAD